MQQLKPFRHELNVQTCYTCHVAAGPVEAADHAGLDRINGGEEDDRKCRGRRLGSDCWRDAGSGNHGYLTTNQIGCQGRQSIILALCPTVFDGDILALDVAGIVQTLAEGGQTEIVGLWGPGAEKADHRLRLLRAGRARPSDRRAADQRDELAAQHAQDTGDAPAAILIGAWRSLVS